MNSDQGVGQRFGANLKRCRRQVGLSQEALAFGARLHRTEISLLETGKRLPKVDTLIKLAGALGVEPAELLAGISWEAPTLPTYRGGFEVE